MEKKFTASQYIRWGAIGLVLLTAVIVMCVFLVRGGAKENPPATEAQTVPTTLPEPTLAANPYTHEDFTASPETGYISCTGGEALHGVDVSFWQGQIDWQTVKESGVEFAMIRLGSRNSKTGVISRDDNALVNLQGATEAGIAVGGYFFSQAKNPQEALEEAEFALSVVEGFTLELPIAFDWEYMGEESRSAGMDARNLTDTTIAFCDRIRQAGLEAMIYFNPFIHENKKMFLEELTPYRFWLAMYDSPMDYPYKVDLWQYSDKGQVPGIPEIVDLNILFRYPEA